MNLRLDQLTKPVGLGLRGRTSTLCNVPVVVSLASSSAHVVSPVTCDVPFAATVVGSPYTPCNVPVVPVVVSVDATLPVPSCVPVPVDSDASLRCAHVASPSHVSVPLTAVEYASMPAASNSDAISHLVLVALSDTQHSLSHVACSERPSRPRHPPSRLIPSPHATATSEAMYLS